MGSIHPRFYKTHVVNAGGVSSSKPTISVELFLDYNCPFSGKLFKKVNTELIPLLKSQGIADEFDFALIHVVQPWHHINSGASHEVALAIAQAYPDQFWAFSSILFENITQFYDTELYNLSRKQVYEKLIKLAVDNLRSIDAKKLWDLVEIKRPADGLPHNSGNKVSDDLKYFTRYQRTVGAHVTPTVFVNGIAFPQIESSTDASAIAKILKQQL
ncbi:DEKNAAC100363 [Brettanomyces naardenensis]|uniref:DEKNAAC100363 n=1 Tax=Brettanomyces naardenensis TaxID=13370 RepID=A0A448YGJ0_BRENA|nr:DEKNAAC100363 [Brettanomyces naardenensis]